MDSFQFKNTQTRDKLNVNEEKLHSSIKQRNLQHHDDQGLSNKVANYLKKSEQKIDDERLRVKDKSDRATQE